MGFLPGYSAVCSQIDTIQETLCLRLEQEIDSFKRRKGIAQESELIRLSPSDRARLEMISELNQFIKDSAVDIRRILSKETISGLWRGFFYHELSYVINDRLGDNNLNKYSGLDKLKIHLLNPLTALIFPVALIKKATTGSFFFSPVGKTKEAVMDARDKLEELLPAPR